MESIVTLHGFQAGLRSYTVIGLGSHLFVKVPRPGDSEVTFSVFESSCHLFVRSQSRDLGSTTTLVGRVVAY